MALLRTGRIPGSKTYSGGNPGQGEDELDRVADLSFRYDPVHEGKRIIGWDFVPVSNKPKEKALPGRRRRRGKEESADAADDSAKLEPEFTRLDEVWLEAASDQRA
jgi:hypothetical protein